MADKRDRAATGERSLPSHIAVCNRIGIDIATGRHAIGSMLAGEVELARQLGVSRSVVREAMRMLAAKGMIDSRPKIGTRVRDRAEWNLLDPQLLGWMFERAPPLEFVRDLFELRLIVEPAAAERAAVRRTARQLSTMGHALERMASHTLATAEGQQADQQFHVAILAAAGNDLLSSLSASIAAAVRWTTYFKYRSGHPLRDSMPQHRALFEAIADRDAAVAHAATVTLIRAAQTDTENALVAE